jgi:hypothetical protein
VIKYKHNNKKGPYKKVCIGMPGQYGDILMQEPGLRKFIEDNPDTKIVLAMAKKYEQVMPLFYDYHENIVDYKSWEAYVDDWPSDSDLEYIREQQFDAMFPPCKPVHEHNDWAKYRHITIETAHMLGLSADDTKINLKLPKEVIKEPKTASIHMFSSKWPGGIRSISAQKQKLIVDYIKSKGYKVYQISSPNQPHIPGTEFPKGTYYDACVRVLSTDFLVSCDSGMPWVSSACNLPTLALFSYGYDPHVTTTQNWWPTNPNGIYHEAYRANDISIYKIQDSIDKLIRRTNG